MSRGVTMRTPERVEEARRLRADGLLLREVAERFGVSPKTVSDWLNDADGSALRARKDSYAQPCLDCGAPTSGSEGRRDEPRCLACASAKAGRERKIWTREAVVLAIQEWAHEYGEPPSSTDWNGWITRHVLHDEERARRYDENIAEGRYPSFKVAYAAFGAWNAAIEAAGFEPREPKMTAANYARSRRARAAA